MGDDNGDAALRGWPCLKWTSSAKERVMQSTVPATPVATPAAPAVALTVTPGGLAAALATRFAPAVAPAPLEPGAQGVAIDGKAQRGRLQYQAGGCPVHVLTAFCHEHGVVLAHEPIEHGADKSEAELTVAPELIA